MPFFAAATAATKSTADRLREIPMDFWVKGVLAIVGIIVAVILLRKLAKMNKVVLAIVVLLTLSIVGFNWIYERNEPAWATPAVQWLAHYFPTKTQMETKGR